MNRCLKPSIATLSISISISALLAPTTGLLGAAVSPAAAAQSAFASTVRPFPPQALRGTLVVTAPPEVLINGKAERLSPGARIRNAQNLLALSGTLVGQELVVNYVRDGAGLIHDVWILNAEEAREKRATSPAH